MPNNGTAAVPYSATRLTRTANNTDEISLESITGMDAYKGSSLEVSTHAGCRYIHGTS